MKHQPKPSPAWRGWPRRGRVWRGPGAFYRTARKDDRPHIRQPLRAATFSPGRRLTPRRETLRTWQITPPQSAFTGRQLPLHRGADATPEVRPAPYPSWLTPCHLPMRGRLFSEEPTPCASGEGFLPIIHPSCGNPIRVSAFCHIKRRNPQWHPTVLCGSTRKFRRNCPP